MDKYEVVGLLGEGSFGRVYKAKQISDLQIVALKVISKRGRSSKEIKGLRRECEIQRHLNHPNIIQMIDSFETENEIVVITEFAHKELTAILSKEGYLTEDRVQAIVWDLVSALYYLHSNRVLHRDLKPQNILIDGKNVAKLCDFGFARNMSTGTHVLTSIKGTPLYMAPELIEEHPYDHTADLWSLGCIIYELLIGSPPFCTSSILHLVRMIRHEQIQWPTFLSEHCISFLKGLLHKNPKKRMSWQEILKHPFVEGHILITEDEMSFPLPWPMSVNMLQVKEQQQNDKVAQKVKPNTQQESILNRSCSTASSKGNRSYKNEEKQEKYKSTHAGDKSTESNKSYSSKKPPKQKIEGNGKYKEDIINKSKIRNKENCSAKNDNKEIDINETEHECSKKSLKNVYIVDTKEAEEITNEISNVKDAAKRDVLTFHADSQPIENEEWIVFLRKTMTEIFRNEYLSLTDENLAMCLLSPLQNTNTNSKVIATVTSLFSMPFIILEETDNITIEVENVYQKIKLIPNLLYSMKFILKEKNVNCNSENSSPFASVMKNEMSTLYKDVAVLHDDDKEAMEYAFLLICNLVHRNNNFTMQFCDSVAVLNMYDLLRTCLLTLSNQKPQLVADLISVLTQILRKTPENWEIVDKVLTGGTEEEKKDFLQLFIHSDDLIRERMCYLIHALGKFNIKTFGYIWNNENKQTLEALMFDSVENVRNAAEIVVEELKELKLEGDGSVECENDNK